MMNQKLIVLATFLGCEVEEVKVSAYSENVFEYENEEYLVCTDKEADQEYYDYQESLIDDLGIQAFSEWAQTYILENFVETEWFDDAMKESYEFYCDDIQNESSSSDEYENRLEEEMSENNCETLDDYVEHLCNSYTNGVEWYDFNFGEESLSKVVKDNNLIDWNSVIEWTKNTDGRSCLAGYDGEENEQDDFYIYRTN